MAFDRTKFTKRFVEEAREHISNLNTGLLSLEKHPNDQETLNAIFRAAHTIKGSSRMLKFLSVTEVAHKLEDALGALRGEKIPHSKALLDLLFRGVDRISNLVDTVAAGQDMTADNSDICDALEQAAEGKLPSQTSTTVSAPPSQEVSAEASRQPLTAPASTSETLEAEQPYALAARQTAKKDTRLKTDETIRVSVERLDALIKLMGELVANYNRLERKLAGLHQLERLSQNHIDSLSRFEQSPFSSESLTDELGLEARSLHFELTQLASSVSDEVYLQEQLIQDLQEKALRMSMQPLSTVFDSFPRTVRDMAASLDKDIDLAIEGSETELDRKIIEKIGDPLLHMIRNAIDHGIEIPEERAKKGKPEKGTIRLSASYEEGSVLIEVSDDGAGIPLQKIKDKALSMKLFDADTLHDMSTSKIVNLIFYPAFTTSTLITDVSGRGVGMDVVKKNIIEELKGHIQIETHEGDGTRFYLRLPPTLAIMYVLLITVAKSTFGIPAHAVTEIVRVPPTDLIDVAEQQAIRLREQLIPVVPLDTLLQLPRHAEVASHSEAADTRACLILIVHSAGEKLGLIIDSLLDEGNLVIKPLPSHMKNIHWVTGVTIIDGSEIVNVLHASTLIEAAKGTRDIHYPAQMEHREQKEIHILVVDDSVSTREIEKSILESYGYKVNLADEGMEALEMTKTFQYDLIITDIEMPRLDGFSLAEKLRQDPAYKYTPIIIVTSRATEEDKRRGMQVGADAYIMKGSFDQSNLLETVQTLVG